VQKQSGEAEALRAERLAHEEALRAAAEAKKKAELRQLRLEAAAYAIQNAWKVRQQMRLLLVCSVCYAHHACLTGSCVQQVVEHGRI
jgi:hypothetical protein